MNLKKILAGAVASVMAVSSLAVGSFAAAADEGGFSKLEVVFKVNTPEEVEFEWELAGQFDADFNDAAEWPDGVKGTAKSNTEVTAVWEFDDDVKLAKNYFGFKTVGVAWSNDEGAENPTMDIISFKVDGREIAVDNDAFHKNHSDNDSASGNLKAVFYNAWDTTLTGGFAIDVDDVNKGNPTTAEPAGDETTSGDETEAPDTTTAPDAAGDGKDPANTGIEGVAVVAGLAVLATGAIVIAKKRK